MVGLGFASSERATEHTLEKKGFWGHGRRMTRALVHSSPMAFHLSRFRKSP